VPLVIVLLASERTPVRRFETALRALQGPRIPGGSPAHLDVTDTEFAAVVRTSACHAITQLQPVISHIPW
jgi:hypothetical protein